MIGGQAHYEIAETYQRAGKAEYRTIVRLGTDPDPQEALRTHQASLVDITRALIRLEPLQNADPAIARKCNTLKSRLKAEQDRIGLLMDAIEQLDGAPGEDDGEGAP